MQNPEKTESFECDKVTISVLLLLFSPLLYHAFAWSADKIGGVNVAKYLFLIVNVFVGIFFRSKDTATMILIGINVLIAVVFIILLGYHEVLIINSIF